jgi:hypothetical protein
MNMRFRLLVAGGMALALSLIAQAQPGPGRGGRPPMIPSVLKEPADWRFEKMPVPPGFAPEVKLNGWEEIRFAPGMFDNTSPTYFTCVLVITAEGAPELGVPAIKDFLEKYYRGLSVGVGRGRGFSPDPAQMNAEVSPAGDPNRYTAKVIFFDSFTDGRKITLNIEARVVPSSRQKQTYLTLLVSTQGKDNALWEKLRAIESRLAFE